MDEELKQFLGAMEEARGDMDAELEAILEVERIVTSNSAKEELTLTKELFTQVEDFIMSTKSEKAKLAGFHVLIALVNLLGGENVMEMLTYNVLPVCLSMMSHAAFSVPCTNLLTLALMTQDEGFMDHVVQKGLIDVLFKYSNAHIVQGGFLLHNPQLRDLCLLGLAELAKKREYALKLHEKDIWGQLNTLYEQNNDVSSAMLVLVYRVIETIGVQASEEETEKIMAQFSGEDEEKEVVSNVKADKEGKINKRVSIKMDMDLMGGKLKAAVASPPEDISGKDEDGEPKKSKKLHYKLNPKYYDEEEGLLDESGVEEVMMTLPERVCSSVDRKGVMGMLLSVCQTTQNDTMAELSLSVLGLLAYNMQNVIQRSNRIIITRVLLNLIEFSTESRLHTCLVVLNSFLSTKGNSAIVIQCGGVARVASAGLKVVKKKDDLSKEIVKAATINLFSISLLENGPIELTNEKCIQFLVKVMKRIPQVQIDTMVQGRENAWGGTSAALSVLTLINVAIVSPVMNNVSEVKLHQGLMSTAKRGDDVGLLATLGAAIMIERCSNSKTKSREIPRLNPVNVPKLILIYTATFDDTVKSSVGGITWSPGELLYAIYALATAEHNRHNLRPMLPVLVRSLREFQQDMDKHDPNCEALPLLIDVLLVLSGNQHIMKEMASSDMLDELLESSLELVPHDAKRTVGTLIMSIENERLIASVKAPSNLVVPPTQNNSVMNQEGTPQYISPPSSPTNHSTASAKTKSIRSSITNALASRASFTKRFSAFRSASKNPNPSSSNQNTTAKTTTKESVNT